MKKKINPIWFLFITLSLTLVLNDCHFIESSFSKQPLNLHRECSDISNHFEHSLSGCFEEDLYINDNKIKSSKFEGLTNLFDYLSVSFKNSYFANIWQPPKYI